MMPVHRYDVLTAVSIQIAVFWNMTPCISINGYQTTQRNDPDGRDLSASIFNGLITFKGPVQ
jgi:hypothetical protein